VGVAPALSGSREVVWRHAGDDVWNAIGIELEQPLVLPDVGAIEVDKDGDIPVEGDVAAACVGAQGLPLPFGTPLQEELEADFVGEGGTIGRGDVTGVVVALRPVPPGLVAQLSQRREVRVSPQPGPVLAEPCQFRNRCRSIECGERPPKERFAVRAQVLEVVTVRVGAGRRQRGVRREQPILGQRFERNQERFKGERRTRSIGRVPRPNR